MAKTTPVFNEFFCHSYMQLQVINKDSQHPNSLNSLPSGMTIGTSGAAPSAERDPDSLEREDDSLFPACLLELFLSHISPAKSPLFFLLCLFLTVTDSWPILPLREHSGQISSPTHPQKPVQSPCQQGVFSLSCDCHFTGDQVQREAFTSTVQSNLACRAALLPLHSHWSIGPLLWFVSIFILCKVLSAVPSHVKHTHICTHRGYISI